MERANRILLSAIMLGCILFARVANGEVFSNFHSGDNYHIYEDSSVMAGALVEFNNLFIDNPLALTNFGEISSQIFIANGTELQFQNSGVFSGEIIFGENSQLTQIIKNSSDINRLNMQNTGNWSVLVQGGSETLSLADIRRMAIGADKIILDQVILILGESVQTKSLFKSRSFAITPIEISGEVLIDLTGTQIYNGMTLMSGVAGDGAVNIYAPDIGRLYYASARRIGEDIILDIARETDYEKIFGTGNARGAFINQMRISGTNRTLLNALDSEMTMTGVKKVMSNSVVFNPVKLMRPVNSFFRQSMAENYNPDSDFNARPIYIFGDGMNLLVGEININQSFENWIFGVSGQAGNFSVSDDFDEYGGSFIGGAVKARWSDKSLWIDSVAGYSQVRFDTDEIFNGTGAISNPNGQTIYFSSNAGADFCQDDFYFSPFIGAGAARDKVLFQSENNFYGQIGGRAGIKTEVMGLQYDYGIFASAGTDSFYSIGAKFGTWSIMDAAGVDVEAAIMNHDFGTAYKLSANIKFNF